MDPSLPRRLTAITLLTALLASPAAAQSERPPAILASLTNAAMVLSPYPLARWRAALIDIDADRVRVQRCLDETPCRDIVAKPLANLVKRFSGLSGRTLIAAVNRHYNTFPYVPDQLAGKPSDDWASPLTFLQRSGDCEDFAIAKYLTLRLLGVPETAMAILVLRDTSRGIDHAVLLVEDKGRMLVLDNLRGLARLEDYGDYQPLFALTADSSWRVRTASRPISGIRPAASQ